MPVLALILGHRFVEALRGAVRHTSKGMGAYISSKMGGSSNSPAGGSQQQQDEAAAAAAQADRGVMRPFPYVVPIVAKSGQLLFDETGRCTKVGCRVETAFRGYCQATCYQHEALLATILHSCSSS